MRLPDFRSSAPWRTLQHRNFRLYTSGTLLSLLGTRTQEIASGWLVWQLTGEATWLGTVALAEIIPRFLVWPWAGVLTDRVDRRKIAFFSQAFPLVGAVLLAFATAFDIAQVWMVVLGHALVGVSLGFWEPSRQAMLPEVVPKADMTPAVAVSSVINQSSRVLGPVVAGLIMVSFGVTAAFAFNAIAKCSVIVSVNLMDLPPFRPKEGLRRGIVGETVEGLRYVFFHPGIGPLMLSIFIFMSTVRPIIDMFPAFADAVFHRGAGGLSMLNGFLGGGALVGGIWASWRGQLKGLVTIMTVATGMGALGILLFSLSENYPFALACCVFAGFGIIVQSITAQTLLHCSVEDGVRGRVFSLYSMVNGGAPGVGAFVMGIIADHLGLHVPVAAGAIIGLGLCAWFVWRRRRLADYLETLPEDRPQAA
jgi:MFS family permease